MALQFSPYPLEPWLLKQRSEQRPDFNQTVTQPLLQGIQTYQQGLELKRQRELQDLQKQKLLQDMENERLANEPLPPFVIQEPFSPQLPLNREGQQGDFYSQFNQRKQMEQMAPRNAEGAMQWLSKLKPQQRTKGLDFLKGISEYEKNIREKPEPMYVIPKVDNEGNVVGYEPVPVGMKPTSFAKPIQTPIDKTTQANIAKAKLNLDTLAPNLQSVIATARESRELNKNSYGGFLGDLQMRSRSGLNTGTDNPKFSNTAKLVNNMQQLVVKMLKPTFGAQFTEREGDFLKKIYGALPGMSQKEREIAIDNVEKMAQEKWNESRQTYTSLSGQNYEPMESQQNNQIQQSRKSATNPQTGEKLYSDDGGLTWHK